MRDSDPNRVGELPERDAKLETDTQVDPFLSEGRSSRLRMAFFGVAAAVLIALVLWGLNEPARQENPATAASGPSTTTASGTPNAPAPGAPGSGRADSSATGLPGGSSNASRETTGQGGGSKP